MNRALVVLILALAAVKCSGSGEVSFSGTSFFMTCPCEERVKWYKENKNITDELAEFTLEKIYNEANRGEYKCKCNNPDSEYYFYVQGKVCENCIELDAMMLMCCIVGDLLVTGGIIIVIYNCAQRKSGTSPAQSATRPRNGSGPSVPNRDYEPLNIATRDLGVYAVAG